MYSIFKMLQFGSQKLYTSNFVIKEIKGQTIISNKQNSEKQSFSDGFYTSENQNKRKIQTENKIQ